MRVLYPSRKGGKSFNIGINRAKRIAHAHDARDQLAVLANIGPGYPRQHAHHQELVRQRHKYYGDAYEEAQREKDRQFAELVARCNAKEAQREQTERLRQATPVAGDPSGGDQEAGGSGGAVPNAAPGPDHI